MSRKIDFCPPARKSRVLTTVPGCPKTRAFRSPNLTAFLICMPLKSRIVGELTYGGAFGTGDYALPKQKQLIFPYRIELWVDTRSLSLQA